MSSDPAFIGYPKIWEARTTTANTCADGSTTTNLVQLIPSVAVGGARVERLWTLHAPASDTDTNSASVSRFFHVRSGVYRLIGEINLTSNVRSSSSKGFSGEIVRTDGLPVLILEAGDMVYVGCHHSEQYDHGAYGGNFTTA